MINRPLMIGFVKASQSKIAKRKLEEELETKNRETGPSYVVGLNKKGNCHTEAYFSEYLLFYA